ncbi:MAG TPA: nuclear transport factor 2 family protein [Acidisarcina sp.]
MKRFGGMTMGTTALLAVSLGVAGLGLAGCTVFPEQKTPTLTMTTSAEQTERIFWEKVRKQEWTQLEPLLAANVVWAVPTGKTLSRDEIVPYLQRLKITDFTMTGAVVKPNGEDMTVTYTLQLVAGPGVAKDITVVSVWQQVKGGAWVNILHSEHAQNS